MSLNKHKEVWASAQERQGGGAGPTERVRPGGGPGWQGLGGLGARSGPEGGLRWVGPSLTILEKELVTGRDREELGLASRRSSSCPLPVLSEPGRGKGGRGGGGGRTRRGGESSAPRGPSRLGSTSSRGGGEVGSSPLPLEEEPAARFGVASLRKDDALCPGDRGGRPCGCSAWSSGNWGRNLPARMP